MELSMLDGAICFILGFITMSLMTASIIWFFARKQ